MPIYLTAILKSKPEHIATLKAMLQDMVVNAKQEKACIQYDLHEATNAEGVFIFQEIWESKEGLAAHNEQPYIKNFGAKAPGLLQEPAGIYLTELV